MHKQYVRFGEDEFVESLDDLMDGGDAGRELDRDAAGDVLHAHVDGLHGRRRHDLNR